MEFYGNEIASRLMLGTAQYPSPSVLAEAFRRQPGCFGARLTGAGFGGAVVAAVRPDSVAACLAAVTAGLGADSRGAFRARSRGGARRGE